MVQRRGLLPREGFTFDVLQKFLKQTLLNPTLTLPLWLLARYTYAGQSYALDNPEAVRRLKVLMYLGIARYINGMLNKSAQNNFTTAKPNWNREFVLITGGSDGIGKLLVRHFASKGVKVVILDIQEPTFELYANCFFIKTDLSDTNAIALSSAQIKEQYGNPTVLVLNAGVINRHTILDTPDHLLRRVFDVNTLSLYRLTREFLPSMVRANHGLVCTTASLASYITVPGMVDYNSTKAAAIAFHEGLTAELVTRYNAPAVRTICICPNFVHTKLAEGFKNESKFISPTLYPETVAEVEFDRIWKWEGGIVAVPSGASDFVMNLRSWPLWMQVRARNSMREVMVDVEAEEKKRLQKLEESKESHIDESIIEVESKGTLSTSMFA